MFQFDGDTDKLEVEPNTLDRPKLAGYYRDGYDNW
jgi:predicted membrane-bound spermidine synthase